jgi:hypothetical protein
MVNISFILTSQEQIVQKERKDNKLREIALLATIFYDGPQITVTSRPALIDGRVGGENGKRFQQVLLGSASWA